MLDVDEISFLVSQKLDYMQHLLEISVRDYTGSLQSLAAQLKEKLSSLDLHSFVPSNTSYRQIHESLNQSKEQLYFLINLGLQKAQQLKQDVIVYITTEVSKPALCFIGTAFCVGIFIGTRIGLSWQLKHKTQARMKALLCTSYTGIDSVSVNETINVPLISKADQILIQVKAASLDLVDVQICQGYSRVLRSHLNRYNQSYSSGVVGLPVILGRGCAGKILAIGPGVDQAKFHVGQAVWCAVPPWAPGVASELAVVPACWVFAKPDAVGWEGAAALPAAACTAWNALVTQARLDPENTKGKRVLIQKGSGSVGCVAIQLIRAWGGHITTTVPFRATPLAHTLGAHVVVPYDVNQDEQEPNSWLERLASMEKFDVVLNTAGVALHDESLSYLKPDGVCVSTIIPSLVSDRYGLFWGGLYSLWLRIRWFGRSSALRGVSVEAHVLEIMRRLVDQGVIRPVVDRSFRLYDGGELALQHAARGEPLGTTVVVFKNKSSSKRDRKP